MNSAAADIYNDGTYLKNHPTWHAEDSEWKASQIRGMLRRNGISPMRVTEVGCGAGEILRLLAMQDPGTQYAGYEISPDAFEMCSRKQLPNLSFHQCDLLTTEIECDVLLCIDVIEHVEDYIGFARHLRAKAEWKLFHIPLEVSVSTVLRDAMMRSRASAGHLHYFSRATALATLRDAGYEIADWCYTRLWVGLPARTWKAAIARIPRHTIYAISPDLCVRLIGGCSLLVLAK